MSSYEIQYLLVDMGKHHLFSEIQLLDHFPCHSISKYIACVSINTIADLTNATTSQEHLKIIINFHQPFVSKLCYSILKQVDKLADFKNILQLLPKSITHNNYCVHYIAKE